MHRIDNTTAATILPTPKPPGQPGFFTPGTVGGQSATIVEADWLNMVQEELLAIVAADALAPNKGTNNQVITAILDLIRSTTRRRLTAPLDLYVAPTGSDTNDGLTPGTAFATPQAAWNYIMTRLDLGAQTVTVHLADGTYAYLYMYGQPVGAQNPYAITFTGNAANPAAVIIAGNNVPAISLVNTTAIFSHLTVQATSIDGNGLRVFQGAEAYFADLHFGPCGGAHIVSAFGGIAVATGAYSIVGGAPAHFQVSNGGFMTPAGGAANPPFAISLVGTPAFSSAFAAVDTGGLINFGRAGYSFTGSGATGKRFTADTTGIIRTASGGPNFFPGSIAGTFDASTYGLYIG